MKFGKPISIDAQVTILCSGDKVELWVEDKDSHNQFLELEMSAEAFTAALGRLAARPAKAIVRGLDTVGMVCEIDQLRFTLPADLMHHCDKPAARRVATQKCPPGWKPDMGFDSQNSFFEQDGEWWARTTIRRWVPKAPDNRTPERTT